VGFLNLFIVTEIGKEQNVQKDGRGSKGSGISFADSDDRGFPLAQRGGGRRRTKKHSKKLRKTKRLRKYRRK
jgi:hypothetical protein